MAPGLRELVHHREDSNLAIRCASWLAEADAAASVASRGDRYDYALAEWLIGVDKVVIERRTLWRTVDRVELVTAGWVEWDRERFHDACGHRPSAEYEVNLARQVDTHEAA